MSLKTLIYIAGPTGIGKTKLSIELAKVLNTEIISCDSRQFYKEMNIGTAVPNKQELDQIPHHFIQHISINNLYTVGDYEKDAVMKLKELFYENDNIIMVGGSGMYADAVMFGIDDFPEIPQETRSQIKIFYQTHGLKGIQDLLLKKDPKYYSRVDIKNPARLIRALEVCIASDQPYSSFLGKERKPRNFISKIIVLSSPRNILYEKINQRVDIMISNGLEDEARLLSKQKNLFPLKTVGYKELFPYYEKSQTLENAVNEIKKNSRRYAKRQITWFNKYENAIRLSAKTSVEDVLKLLK